MHTESTRNVETQAKKHDEAVLETLWFDSPPPSGVRRASSFPPPPAEEKVGEFLGDPDVDSWLR